MSCQSLIVSPPCWVFTAMPVGWTCTTAVPASGSRYSSGKPPGKSGMLASASFTVQPLPSASGTNGV